jgi:hypothetical protein
MLKYTCIKIISAPASARAMAAACPMPLVPPVTRAVCPSKENILAVSRFAIFQIETCVIRSSDGSNNILCGSERPTRRRWGAQRLPPRGGPTAGLPSETDTSIEQQNCTTFHLLLYLIYKTSLGLFSQWGKLQTKSRLPFYTE